MYGQELILDLHECKPETFTAKNIEEFCLKLCEVIDMNPEDFHIWASDPADYDTDPPHLHGVSAVQFITTSNLTIHTLPKLGQAYINIFSCKGFDADVAAEFTKDWFNGEIVSQHVIERL